MIQFEDNSSPLYAVNQAYCNSIAEQLEQFKATCQGFCNSYGFNINATWQHDDLTFTVECKKLQTTQNGVVMPVSAHVTVDTIVKIRGLKKDYKMQLGPSALKRWFSNKQWQLHLPKPYYMSTNYAPSVQEMKNFAHQIQAMELTCLRMSNGKLIAEKHQSTKDIAALVKNMEQLVQPWH